MIRKLQIIFTFLWLAGPAMAQAPNFDYPYLIPIPGGYIVPSNDFAIPCVGDWDDDGDTDLLVGVMYDGNVIFYENVSARTLPHFAAGVLLEADGEPISVSYA